MNPTSHPDPQIEAYLAALHSQLAPMAPTDREDILREIAAHVRDSVEETGTPVGTVLARLGPPAELAAQYRDSLLIQSASRSLSPVTLLRATLRVATKGAVGVVVFLCGFVGYITGGSLVIAGLLKPFAPNHVGIFMSHTVTVDSVTEMNQAGQAVTTSMRTNAAPHEMLGWWGIPIALVGGVLILIVTTVAIRLFLRASKHLQGKLAPNTGTSYR